MKKNDILENLCMHDKRNPEYYDNGNGVDTKSLDDKCECCECLSNRKELALAMLKMISCVNCRYGLPNYGCMSCDLPKATKGRKACQEGNHELWELKE